MENKSPFGTKVILPLEASMMMALVAFFITSIIIILLGKYSEILLYVLPSSLSTFLATFILWPFFFNGNKRSWLRSIMVGFLIVLVAMFGMWSAVIIIASGSLEVAKYILFFGLIGLFTLGVPLTILSILSVEMIRRYQLIVGNKKPLRKRTSQIIRGLAIFLFIVFILIIVFLLGIYILFTEGNVHYVSSSPSGKKTFIINEGCFGHACWHTSEIVTNIGWFKSTSKKCELGIHADFTYFSSKDDSGGVREPEIIWSKNEDKIHWISNSGYEGEVNFSDCYYWTQPD